MPLAGVAGVREGTGAGGGGNQRHTTGKIWVCNVREGNSIPLALVEISTPAEKAANLRGGDEVTGPGRGGLRQGLRLIPSTKGLT